MNHELDVPPMIIVQARVLEGRLLGRELFNNLLSKTESWLGLFLGQVVLIIPLAYNMPF